MGMAGIIQHNMLAAFGARNLGIVDDKKAKSAEKLASGYKINHSSDDAAGLFISEDMRRLIRGLDQGADNIGDGISLCQIADGALDEVNSVLQRVRELSIQAYNGTNSRNDRETIQTEVESCLGEIDEIKERTKFNEIYILRGSQEAVKSKATSRTKEINEVYTTPVRITELEPRTFPNWIVLNDGVDKLIGDHGYTNYDAEISDDMIMKNDYEVEIDGKKEKVSLYFGKKQDIEVVDGGIHYEYIADYVEKCQSAELDSDTRKQYDALLASNVRFRDFIEARSRDTLGNYTGFTYEGWTETKADNVSCKIDLGGLVSASGTVDQLYSNIDQLLGCEIGFPCGTCSQMQILRFSGENEEHKASDFARNGAYWRVYQNEVEISLSGNKFQWNNYAEDGSVSGTKEYDGYFNAIESLKKISDPALQASELNSLAEKIASDLAARMHQTFEDAHTKGNTSHFDRSAIDKTSDQILYVYDYRDKEVLSTVSAADSMALTTTGFAIQEYTVYEEGVHTRYETIPVYPKHDDQIKIQASANSSDYIPLELREISRDTLKLEDYTVSGYTYKSVLSDNYYRKLEQYKKDMMAYEKKLNEVEYETRTGTRSVRIIDKPAVTEKEVVSLGYKDGEFQGYETKVNVISQEESHYEDRTYEYKVPIGALPEEPQKPKEEYVLIEYYTPSPLELIDNAMIKVNDLRSYFGAMQNRLEHAYANNKNTQENLEASESRIRDTDMAEEMVNQAKTNILQQAGQAMLAQANRSRDSMMKLLE